MEHKIALVTGATSGLGQAAARLLAEEGWREIIVTGRSLAGARKAAAQLAAEHKTVIFTPLALDLDKPSSVQSAVAELVKRGQPIDFLLLNAGLVPFKKRAVTATGVESSQAPLIGHHQLTVGLLNANLVSPSARIVIAGAEPARGGVPMFKYTDLPAFAAKRFQGNRTAAAEALIRNGPNVKYVPNNAYADAKLIVAWWTAALAKDEGSTIEGKLIFKWLPLFAQMKPSTSGRPSLHTEKGTTCTSLYIEKSIKEFWIRCHY